jgi:hypothetical protein
VPASHVQVAPDGSGKDVDAVSIVSTEAGTPTVYRQVVVLGDPSTYGNQATVSAAGAVKVDGSAVTQPVTGTIAVGNFPATQPVSISGSVPVSGAVSVSNFPGSQPVTGTFWQSTQPVSGTLGIVNDELLLELKRVTLCLQLLCADHGIQIDEGVTT